MILPYALRLLLLCAASYFVVYCAASLAVCAAVPAVMRRSAGKRPRREATLLAALRLLPLLMALFAVAALCVPGYLRFEPEADAERAGVLSILAALCGAAIVLYGFTRAGGALWRSVRSARDIRRSGSPIRLDGEAAPASVLDSDSPLLALIGLARPRVVVSRGLLSALSFEQFDAALRHEQAHRASCDNAKRLLFLLAPDPFVPLGRLEALERAWARLAEWAADDRAAAGDPRRALSLAEALVRVARMGCPAAPCPISAQLISDGSGLRERVHRLVELASQPAAPVNPSAGRLLPLSIVTGVLVLAFACQSQVLYSAHQLLEAFLR